MRVHGVRRDSAPTQDADEGKADPNHPNVANEVWSYGEETCAILSDQIRLRERIKPYVMDQMNIAETSGLPPMRPLFVDFPDDPQAWEVEDQFMFGADILVAPVLSEGLRSRSVYLPKGVTWQDAWTGEPYEGGQTLDADAPLEQIPVYVRAGRELTLV